MPKNTAVRVALFGAICGARLLFAAESDQKPASHSSDALNVLYSGRFFGYFRYPDIQTRSAQGCPSDGNNLSAAAVEYLKHVGPRPFDQIRVAMGDNFAPEFLARVLYDDEPASPSFKSRDLYTPVKDPSTPTGWNWTLDDPKNKRSVPLEGSVPSDNVGCFLKKAEFQVVVPGKDDFYFGPERVSQIASFLWRRSGDLPSVQMLGANLTVVTTQANGYKPLPIEKLNKTLQNAFLGKPGVKFKFVMPTEVLPWLHHIDFESKSAILPPGFLCETDGKDPYQLTLPGFGRHTDGCSDAIIPTAAAKPDSFRYTLPNNSQVPFPFFLQPGRSYAFCVQLDLLMDDSVVCQPFTARQPLFQVPIPKNLQPEDPEQPRPYFVDAKRSVAIFGVVDQDMVNQIGTLNYSWRNVKSKFATTLKIIPSLDALEQVMQLCEEDADCRNAKRRILLAEMPANKAQDLTRVLMDKDKIRFDLVITQVDRDNYTGTTSLSRLEKNEVSPLKVAVAARDPFILVPDAQYEPELKDDKFTVRVQTAQLGRKACPGSGEACSYLQNDVEEYRLPASASHDVQAKLAAFNKKIDESAKVKGSPEEELVSLTKENMQTFCHSDLAILQPRDIFARYETVVAFWPESYPTLYTEENYLDEILWKGDFAICRTITGASLKKALQQSKLLQTSSPALKLDTLGVEPDRIHDTYIIHGNQLDEKALYSVALTDFLAFGDTLYPDLAAPDLPPTDSIHTFDELRPISNLVAVGLYPNLEVQKLSPGQYFDPSDDKPADQTAGFGNKVKILDWLEHWAVAYEFTPALGDKDGDEKNRAQHRSLTYFNLEKLNVAYNLTTINGPQQLANARFGSITNVPQLQNVEQQSVTIWDRTRFGHEFPKWLDLYGATDNRYGFKRLRKISTITSSKVGNGEITGYQDPYSSSIQDNAIAGEAGVLFKRVAKNIPFRFLFAERILTQMRRPLLGYTAPYLQTAVKPSGVPSNCDISSSDVKLPVVAGSSSASILCTVPRSYLQETKIGTRLENRDSWIEFGWEAGHNFNSTGDAFFNRNAPNQLPCPANTELSLSDCITTGNANNTSLGINQLSPLYITHRTLPLSGAFVNFKILIPIFPPKFQLNIENYSEFFVKRAQDNATDTRFYEDAIISLPIKLGQNFTFSPQVELFDFQNKVVPYHFLSLVSQFTLDYNFAWHSGVRGNKALTYPYPTSVSKTQTLPVP